jgi:hypothetical protein
MNRMSDEIINRFEEVIAGLKAPLLDATDTPLNSNRNGDSPKNSEQDIEKVFKEVGSRMDELYSTIKSIIDTHGVPSEAPLNTHTLNRVFLQNGINIGELSKDRDTHEKLLNTLKLLLKEYPLTRSAGHTNKLKNMHTEVSQILISNNE